MADEVSRRRNAKRGPIVRDDLIAGPNDGMRIIFCETELERIVTQDNPPSGTTRRRSDSHEDYLYWDETVNVTGSFIYRGTLQNRTRQVFNLIVWLEYYCWPQAMNAVDQMIIDGWTDANKRRALKSVLVSWGVPAAQAITVAADYINNGTKPTFGDLGMTNYPKWSSRMTLLNLSEDEDDTER